MYVSLLIAVYEHSCDDALTTAGRVRGVLLRGEMARNAGVEISGGRLICCAQYKYRRKLIVELSVTAGIAWWLSPSKEMA